MFIGAIAKVHTGWTIGGGLEWASAIVGALSFAIEFDIQTVKAGLNDRFGAGKGPVAAKY